VVKLRVGVGRDDLEEGGVRAMLNLASGAMKLVSARSRRRCAGRRELVDAEVVSAREWGFDTWER
jgi:hypothetical protein